MRRIGWTTSAALSLAVFTAVVEAQDRLYVSEDGAAIRLHGLTFNGSAFGREDLSPSLAQSHLNGGSELQGVAATDRLLVVGTFSASIGLNVYDPLNGIELPRVGTTARLGTPVLSADQHYAFIVGNTTSGALVLSVVDLRPWSANFLKEIVAPTLAASGTVLPGGMTLGLTGQFLYVGITTPQPGTDGNMYVQVVDVSNPAAPAIQSISTVPQPAGAPWPTTPPGPNTAATSLRVFNVAGKTFLFAARLHLYIMEVQPDGNLVSTATPGTVSAARVRSFSCPTSACSSGSFSGRTFRDIYAADTPSGPRVFLVSDRPDVSVPVASRPQIEEVVVLDLTGLTAASTSDDVGIFSGISSRVKRIEVLSTSGINDNETLAAGSTGSLFVLSPGDLRAESATITAINLAALAVTTGGPSALITPIRECIAEPGNATCATPVGQSYAHPVFSLRTTPFSSPPPPTISAVKVDGATPPILINDTNRTVTIEGTGLSSVTHVFAGFDRLCLNAPSCPTGGASPTVVTAISDPLIPSSQRPLIVVDASGGIAVSRDLTVSNPPTFLPAHQVYGLTFAGNAIDRFQSASSTSVVESFSTLSAPTRGAVSADGKWLYITSFRSGSLAVHSLFADPVHSYTWNEEITNGSIFLGGAPQGVSLDDSPDRSRKRLYVTTVDGSIAMLDTGATPPVLVDTDNNIGTTDDDDYSPATTADQPLAPGISKINVLFDAASGGTEVRTAVHPSGNARGLVVSSDGNWLYVSRIGAPHLVAINVSDDNVTAADRTFISLSPGATGGPIPAGGPAAPGTGRADGMVIVGSRLYYTSSTETKIRIFDINGAVLTQASPVSEIPIPGPLPGTRNLAALPDGRFLYATSRAGARVDIIDLATDTWVTSLPTGLFTDGVSPSPDSNFVYVASAEKDVLWTVDARPGSPTLHQRIASSGGGGQLGTAIAVPGLETPVGSAVEVQPSPAVTLTFDGVTSPGNTTVTSTNVTAVPMPVGFSVLQVNNPVYYEMTTTATFTAPIKVCVTYSDADVMGVDESTLRLMHEEAGTFEDRTIGPPDTDSGTNRICASVSSFSQFAIALAPPSNDPVAVDDLATTWSGAAVSVSVLANDSDADAGQTLTVTGTSEGPSNGSVMVNGDGTITYTPVLGFAGTDSFAYAINDGHGGTARATVTVTVTRRSATVHAGGGSKVYGGADPAMPPSSSGFMAADVISVTEAPRDPGESVGSYATHAVAAGTNLANYQVTYTDGSLSIIRAGLIVTANSLTAPHGVVPFPPFSAGYVGFVNGETSAALGGALVVTTTANGASPAGLYPLAPSGLTSANYAISFVNGTLTLTNQAPVAVKDAYSTQWNTVLAVPARGVLLNDTDSNSDLLTAVRLTDPSHGTVTLSANGGFSYMPEANFSGYDSFTYKANDGLVDSEAATVSIRIVSPCRNDKDDDDRRGRRDDDRDDDHDRGVRGHRDNDGCPRDRENHRGDRDDRDKNDWDDCKAGTPDSHGDKYETRKNATLTVAAKGVLKNDGSSAAVAQLFTSPLHGTVTLASNGGLVYAPAAGFVGTDLFYYVPRSATNIAGAVTKVTIKVQGHWDGDGCDHDRKRKGHRGGDRCEHDDAIRDPDDDRDH